MRLIDQLSAEQLSELTLKSRAETVLGRVKVAARSAVSMPVRVEERVMVGSSRREQRYASNRAGRERRCWSRLASGSDVDNRDGGSWDVDDGDVVMVRWRDGYNHLSTGEDAYGCR